MSLWANDLTDERLISLRKQNLSFGKIAVRLSEETGQTIRRDCVLGRARRLYHAGLLTRPEKKVDGKPVVTAPVQSHLSSVPPNFFDGVGRPSCDR